MSEEWKEIAGTNGNYFVSNLGNVKSEYWKKGKILTPSADKNGYLFVGIRKNGIKRAYTIHRLVAEAFIPNPQKHTVVNHIDENKKNNKVTNLEWCTQKHNVLHSINRLSQRRKIVRSDGKEYASIADAMREMNLKSNHISDVCRGKRQKAGGYGFKYKEEIDGTK